MQTGAIFLHILVLGIISLTFFRLVGYAPIPMFVYVNLSVS